MADRYRGYAPVGRSATFNPARASLPNSVGYSSMYAGDVQVMPASTRHPTITPRGYSMSTNAAGVPTTTRTYAVNQDPRHRSGPRDSSRNRRSTLDSSMRPPVIITTRQGDRDRPHGSSYSAHPRNGSPVREGYRSGGDYWAQPASSMRSHSAARPYHAPAGSEDYGRPKGRRDSLLSPQDADTYRSSRPSVVYPSDPHHSTAVIDYGDDGYKYTNVGELVKYDLDQSSAPRHRRHESFDRGYRPGANYYGDERTYNVNRARESGRKYYEQGGRFHDDRSGPPPSTRGFDKIERGYDVPPKAPIPPSPTSRQPEGAREASERREARRERPSSMYNDAPPRSSHHDDYYRSREDERNMRELRDKERDRDRDYDSSQFHDQNITNRGFGIRTGPLEDVYDDRRERRYEPRREEPRKRSDEELSRGPDVEREDRRRSRQPETRDTREARAGDGDDDNEGRSHFKEKMATGLGVAAAAVGLASSKTADVPERDEKTSNSRSSPERPQERRKESPLYDRAPPPPREDDERRRESSSYDRAHAPRREDEERRRESPTYDRAPAPRREDEYERFGHEGQPRERENSRKSPPQREPDEGADLERHHRNTEAKLNGEPAAEPLPESDEGAQLPRRHRPSNAFNPNDASDLKQIREQLATMSVSDQDGERERSRVRNGTPGESSAQRHRPERDQDRDRERPAVEQAPRTRSPSPNKDNMMVMPPRDDDESRGRELVVPNYDKQVRVVSPPRDKRDDKPLKGILKQPKSSFPEQQNFIREGAAPHKEDKKLKDAPPGARWTKINRKVVNPEALSIGKERFEVRDDFVIVLRVLSKEEIQAYASATQILRERRRRKDDGEERDDDQDDDRDQDGESRRRHHRHHHHRHTNEEDNDHEETRDRDRNRERGKDRERDGERDRDREHGRERRRRHRKDDDEDSYSRESDEHSHRSHRDHERNAA